MSKLKPCPFCGGTTAEEPRFIYGTMRYQVRCLECKACGPIGETEGIATRKWDKRVEDKP